MRVEDSVHGYIFKETEAGPVSSSSQLSHQSTLELDIIQSLTGLLAHPKTSVKMKFSILSLLSVLTSAALAAPTDAASEVAGQIVNDGVIRLNVTDLHPPSS
jgi:hypothetical protein